MQPAQPAPQKPSWQSKPFCLMVLSALAPIVASFHPAAGEFLHQNSEFVCTAVALIAGGFGWHAPTPGK